jgi:hypothetical protein
MKTQLIVLAIVAVLLPSFADDIQEAKEKEQATAATVEPVREKTVVKMMREEAEVKALAAAQTLLKDKPSHRQALRQDGPATLAGVPRQPTWYVGFMADNGLTGIGIRVTVDAVTGEAQAVVAQGGR